MYYELIGIIHDLYVKLIAFVARKAIKSKGLLCNNRPRLAMVINLFVLRFGLFLCL